MCGINLLLGIDNQALSTETIKRMNARMSHRGPDSDGLFVDSSIAMGHRRLSIIDLSAAANQPMSGLNNRYQIIYNGEFYNYSEVKQKLLQDSDPFPFQYASDTEVIIAAYHKWGVDCLQYLNGMFAFAIYDAMKAEVFIARDRLGIKPLYYYQQDSGVLLFSSEIRSLLASEMVPRKLNQDGLVDYLRYQTVHAPQTILSDVMMMMPGTYMLLSLKDKLQPIENKYWKLSASKHTELCQKSYSEVCSDVRQLLSDSVKRRLVADVPFGAFLSGGIDSSAVVGIMSEVADQKVRTFSVTFDETEFSEAKYAKLISQKFNTEHNEIRLTADYFLKELPEALAAMDHPSGDGPNTFVVSKVTKQSGITMALSGLGGDELFAGYDVFKRSVNLKRNSWIASMPQPLKNIANELLKKVISGSASVKMEALLNLKNFELEHTYPLSRMVLADPVIAGVLNFSKLPENSVNRILRNLHLSDFDSYLSKVSAAEISTYMQNVLLRDTDQMSMASALEVRVPFLDFHLVDYVLSVPDRYKFPHTPKKLLTDALGDLLPLEIINRPKMGFTLPWQNWMKNEMKRFCEDRLNSLANRSLFKKEEIEKLWYAFLQNSQSVTWSRLWYLVVLEDWIIQNKIEC